MSEETQVKLVKLENTGEIELPQIDVSGYVGNDVNIVSVTEHEGKHGYFIKVETEVVETIERDGDKDDIILSGKRNFGLHEDDESNIGWGKDTKLGQYLKKMKVAHYNELVGKTVKLQTNTINGVDFLTFN